MIRAGRRRNQEEEQQRLKAETLAQNVEIARQKLSEDMERFKKLEAESRSFSESVFGKRHAPEGEDENAPPMKIRRTENPFRAKISSYDHSLLLVNNPFIDVTHCTIREMPDDNVVDGKLMNKQALDAAILVLTKAVVEATAQYKSAATELGGRILHASILKNIKLLTVASTGAEVWVGGKEEISPDNYIEQESDEVRHEGGEVVQVDEILRLDRYDLKGKVLDKELNTKVTVLIIECDWKGCQQKLYQASGYCIRAATQNMRKGRFKPIYIHNWSKSVWRHGVLRPTGLITVKNGRVVEYLSGDGIMKREPEDEHEEGERYDLFKGLDEKLKLKTTALREDYVFPYSYPDGVYVNGSIHLNTTEMSFPVLGDGISNEAMIRFANAVIRTFVGDGVLKYTKEDVEKNVEARNAQFEKETHRRHDGHYSSSYDNVELLGTRFQFGVDLPPP